MNHLTLTEREALTHEQQVRDILERMGIEGAQNFSSGEIIEIANLLRKIETLEKKAERLSVFQKWADEGNCPALINDDDGRWAVSFDGMQNVNMGDGPIDIQTTFFVEAADWKDTVEDAIDAAIATLTQEQERIIEKEFAGKA